MPRVTFTTNLVRHVECPSESVDAPTVRAALERYFERYPKVRGYVLDEQGTLRHHVVVFVGGEQVRDRYGLSDGVEAGAEIYVMQALSGG